jgi:small conductance mechanosensitive channel
MDWNSFWNSVVSFFENNVWNIVGFFVALILGIVVVKIVLNITNRIMRKTKMEKVAQSFLYGVLKFVLYLILVMILLSIIGVSMTGVLTAVSAVLLAIGLALESNIANLANGIIIVSSHMFKKGDYIIVGGVEGSIDKINFLFTTLITPDNKRITIPNSTIVNSSVVDVSAQKTRRLDLTFSVAYESDVEMVKKIVKDVMLSDGRVMTTPAPFCRLKTLNTSSLDFFAYCWVDAEDYWDVYYYILETVYNEFKRNKISIPYNQLEVRQCQGSATAPFNKEPLKQRQEKVRKAETHTIDLEKDDIAKIIKDKIKAKKDKTKTAKENEKK